MENYVNTPVRSSITSNIVFLLLSLPLGLLYFTVTVTGISLGVGTLVIWIGLPILFVTLAFARIMAGVERRLVSSLLHLPVPYQVRRQVNPGQGFLRRFGEILRDPYTWTSLIYMFLKMPLGIISFVLTVTLTAVSFVLVLFPLGYLINLLVVFILLRNGITSHGDMIPGFIEIHGSFDSVMFARSFLGIPVGIILWIVTRYVLNILALMSGELAYALLGPGEMVEQPQQDLRYTFPAMMQEQRTNVD